MKVFKLVPWMMMGKDTWCKTMMQKKKKNPSLHENVIKFAPILPSIECIQYVKHRRIFFLWLF
jgi:hypothetical protein